MNTHSTITENSKIPLAYIASSARSGSTLLGMLLDTHPDMVTVGEMMNIYKALECNFKCSCGKRANECMMWKQVSHLIKPKHDRKGWKEPANDMQKYIFTLGNLLKYVLHVKPHKKLADAYTTYEKVFSLLLEIFNAKVIVDISKSPYYLLDIASLGLFNIKIIHIIRDGRGVLYSKQKRGKKESVIKALFKWTFGNTFFCLLGKTYFRNMYIRIHYEDLCLDPQKTLKAIFSFLDLPPLKNCADKAKESSHHIIAGNIGIRTRRFENIVLDDEWKKSLPLRNKIFFALFSGWLNRLLGYH